MSYRSVVWNPWRWLFSLMGLLALFFSWNLVVKPHEMKRLQREAAQTAERLLLDFYEQSENDLASIATVFSHMGRGHYEPEPQFMQNLYTHFKQVHGFETFVLPSPDTEGSFVLFNPYVTHTDNAIVKDRCDRMLEEHPEWVKSYGKLTILPIEQSLCVYGPEGHMLAILNLNTTIDAQLKQEMMNGYFLALLDVDVTALDDGLPSWAPPWVYRQPFDFLGTHWALSIYPSKAYIEASMKRVFLVFCLMFLGGVGLFGWWFLGRRVRAQRVDVHYMKHLKQLALYDGVTNLPNRRYCLDYLGRVLNRAHRKSTGFSVCFMDCNDFKGINDTYGHDVGDLVLRHIADEVSHVIRKNDFFARFAGDEFCLILEDTSTDESIQVVLDKIIDVISNPIFVGEASIVVGVSIGVAVYPSGGESPDALLKHADMAMYDSKRRGEAYVIYRQALPL